MRESGSTAKSPTEFSVNTLFPFYRKVHSPPYCCAVLLDLRLTIRISIRIQKEYKIVDSEKNKRKSGINKGRSLVFKIVDDL